jgi:thermolabile hemolysin
MIERGWGWQAVAITLVAFIGVTNVDAQAQDTGSARFSEGVEAPQLGGESEGASTRVRETLTSLRCYYETSGDSQRFVTRYVWATAAGSDALYRLPGSWHGGQQHRWQALFYTDVTPGEMHSLCDESLRRRGIVARTVMYAAGNGASMLDYTPWSVASQGVGIDRVIAFGDSLSDTHNLYNASRRMIPDSASWFAGRFTNGRNWVEYLAGDLNLPLYDWAVGGVGVGDRRVLPWAVLPGVLSQARQWREATRDDPTYDPGRTLFTVLVGGNDLIYFDTPVDEILEKERSTLQVLIDGGAKNILVMNLPDVSRAPIFRLKSGAPDVATKVQQINRGLAAIVADLQQQHGDALDIHVFDTNVLFEHLFDDPGAYGFQNATQSCLDIDGKGVSNFMEHHAWRATCKDPNKFVFWDILHPTTRTHRILADGVASFVREHYQRVRPLGA